MTKLSIIIPTYNEEKDLVKCLTSLDSQTYNDFEAIVVDDGSTDKTLEKLSNLALKNYEIKLLKQDHRGAGAARNFGAGKAVGEILVFVDADMTFDENFLKNLIAPIVQGKVKGTFSKDEFVSNWENLWARCWNINEGWEDKKRHPKNYPDTQPVFRAILKSEFEKVDGFTPGGYDDDWSLAKKLGYNAVVAPDSIFYHKNPSSLGEIFMHAKWVAKRKYKAGLLGYMVALLRSSIVTSLVVGIYKALAFLLLPFILFKIVYDFGVFVGIVNYLLTGRSSK